MSMRDTQPANMDVNERYTARQKGCQREIHRQVIWMSTRDTQAGNIDVKERYTARQYECQ